MADPSLFKTYDIRGRAEGPDAILNTDVAQQIGRASSLYFQRTYHTRRVIVGRDNRQSSESLQESLVQGLLSTGSEVIDVGLVSSPLIHWQAVKVGNCAGIMVTGSHLPPDQNGFKLCIGARSIWGEEISTIQQLLDVDAPSDIRGQYRSDNDASARYLQHVASLVKPQRQLSVVIDAGNGTAGLFAPGLLDAWNMAWHGLYLEPDGRYPNHQPDPGNLATLHALVTAVRDNQADIGLAFDGDADRLGVVDEQGNIIAADRILAMLALDALKRVPGATVVADVTATQVLFDAVTAAGGQPVMVATGHARVKAAMQEYAAIIGGETSGHLFMAESYGGFDDPYLAMGRLLALLAEVDRPLSELDAALPRLASSPLYRPHCPEEWKAAVITAVADALSGEGDVTTVDGIRIRFADGWGLLRASNTEAALTLRFEAVDETALLAIRKRFEAVLRQFDQVGPLI